MHRTHLFVSVADAAKELELLASQIRRMRPPDHRNPEAFHLDRSDCARRAAEIANWILTGVRVVHAEETPARANAR